MCNRAKGKVFFFIHVHVNKIEVIYGILHLLEKTLNENFIFCVVLHIA